MEINSLSICYIKSCLCSFYLKAATAPSSQFSQCCPPITNSGV